MFRSVILKWGGGLRPTGGRQPIIWDREHEDNVCVFIEKIYLRV